MALREEHPQIGALALVLAGPECAASILPFLTERLRNDIVLRMCTMDTVEPRWIAVMDQGLGSGLSEAFEREGASIAPFGGAAETLSLLDDAVRSPVLENVGEYDPDLRNLVVDRMKVIGASPRIHPLDAHPGAKIEPLVKKNKKKTKKSKSASSKNRRISR